MANPKIVVNYEVCLTYRCNLSCEYCDRFIDAYEWPNSDVTLEDVRTGGELIGLCGMTVLKLRITGGEPTLHPDLGGICLALKNEWPRVAGRGFTRISTNGTTRFRRIPGVAVRKSPPKMKLPDKKHQHWPPMISPADLGFADTGRGYSTDRKCRLMAACGPVFDAFGFTWCHRAGPIGRILGIDPYSPEPVLNGSSEICRHCTGTLGEGALGTLHRRIRRGELDHPTETYRRAVEQCEGEGPMGFRRFRERLG